MATVKPARPAKANVPPTHPTVWVGLGLAVVGLVVATYAYTGARVYEIGFAFVALIGAILALAGILVAAWGRSIMAARASRSRRAAFQDDAMALAKPVAVTELSSPPASEDAPTVAASREKKRFSFPMPKPKRGAKTEPKERAAGGGGGAGGSVFAFKRRTAEPAPAAAPEPAPTLAPERAPAAEAAPTAEPAPAIDAELDAIGDLHTPKTVRVTLKCPSCATTFTAEGVRPFQAVCSSCGFSATV